MIKDIGDKSFSRNLTIQEKMFFYEDWVNLWFRRMTLTIKDAQNFTFFSTSKLQSFT